MVTYRDEAIVFSPVKRLLRLLFSPYFWSRWRSWVCWAGSGTGCLRLRRNLRRSNNKELENLFYSIAHDLRAPLRAMRGLSGILLEESAEKLDDSGKDYAQRIVDSAGRMDRLVNDLFESDDRTSRA